MSPTEEATTARRTPPVSQIAPEVDVGPQAHGVGAIPGDHRPWPQGAGGIGMSIADDLEAVLGTTGGGYLRDEDVTTVMAAVSELRRLRRMVNIAQEKTPGEMLDAEDRAQRAEAELIETNAEVVRLHDTIVNCRQSAGLKASPDGPTGDVTNLLHRGDVTKMKWARLLLERDNVQGRKVLERMVAYYDEHDGKAADFGRLFIVTDAMAALGD